VRNNGFIDKAYDIALENPQFMPLHFNVDALVANMHELEDLPQLLWTLQQFTQADKTFIVNMGHGTTAYNVPAANEPRLLKSPCERLSGSYRPDIYSAPFHTVFFLLEILIRKIFIRFYQYSFAD